MACQSIGQANPDIAGIGILAAFVIQSLIAVVVSGYTFVLSVAIQWRWKEADPNPSSLPHPPAPSWSHSFEDKSLAFFGHFPEICQVVWKAILQTIFHPDHVVKSSSNKCLLHSLAWLVGKQPEHARERTEESKIEDEITPTTRRLKFANRILLAGNDSQTFTGIALLISALVQRNTLSLYHMHVLYDTISLVVISNCAASVCVFGEGRLKGYTRVALISIWAVLFVAYFSIFATRLQQWDEDVPFRCYRTEAVSKASDSHPYADNIYVGVTFFFVVVSFYYAMGLALDMENRLAKFWSRWMETLPDPGETRLPVLNSVMRQYISFNRAMIAVPTNMQMTIIQIALLQCPVHIYSIFALRRTNERYLEAGLTERDWGFGQIVAIVLLGANILPIVDGITGYEEERGQPQQRVTSVRHSQEVKRTAGCHIAVQGGARNPCQLDKSISEQHLAHRVVSDQITEIPRTARDQTRPSTSALELPDTARGTDGQAQGVSKID